jgi:hypothetical protein
MARIFFRGPGRSPPGAQDRLERCRPARRAAASRDARALQTAEDFREAALVFQHGPLPEDLLALAMVAVAKGDPSALWIATATLDRYLWATK